MSYRLYVLSESNTMDFVINQVETIHWNKTGKLIVDHHERDTVEIQISSVKQIMIERV